MSNIFKSIFDGMYIDDKAITVKEMKRPTKKPVHKLKLDGATYYITDLDNKLIAFEYKSHVKDKVKSMVIASVFDKALCRGKDFMTLQRKYNDEINKFNGQEFIHSQYITDSILEKIFLELNK